MGSILKQGRLLFGIAITVFGAETWICARYAEAVVPVIPWVPGNVALAYVIGAALLAGGFGIMTGLWSRTSATFVGLLLLVSVLVFHTSSMVTAPLDLRIRTRVFESVALGASAILLAAAEPAALRGPLEIVAERLSPLACMLFAVSSIIFGIDHFLVLAFIASLVPAWIPFHWFWAVFTGAAFIAAGLAIGLRWRARLAAGLLGLMFLFWFLLLHAPRVLSGPRSHDPNGWSSAFIALAMCGGSWGCARHRWNEASNPRLRPRLLEGLMHFDRRS
jgi:uncharacterized membrane protein